MYEFLQSNPLYTVFVIVLICWVGIFSYLVRLDRKLSRVERREIR